MKKLNEEFRSKCIVSSGNVWMNEQLTKVWVKKVLGKFSFGRRLLAWDSFSCHILDTVKGKVKESNLDMILVLGGCTKYIQAPDDCWNAPFKGLVAQGYEAWMADGSQEITAQGNMKAPSRPVIAKWILETWNSFRSTGSISGGSFQIHFSPKSLKI